MKKSVIIIPVVIVGVLFLGVLCLAALGFFLYFRSASDTETAFAATEAGVPVGESVTKDIGPAGGTLVSPDSRLTLTVPPDALVETIRFSIQPVTNKFAGGLGLSYKLEPEGKTFETPLDVSFRYDDKDLEGTFPEALSIAYQDGAGIWHVQKEIDLDTDKKTITFAAAHFSVIDLVFRTRLLPPKATVKVGESVKLLPTDCNPVSRIFAFISVKCFEGWGTDDRWKLAGEGKITGAYPHMIYTAPAKKPSPNVSTVILYKDDFLVTVETPCPPDKPRHINLNTGKEYPQGKCFKQVPGPKSVESVITIIDKGYRAAGKTADLTYSGMVCDLEKPFTVKGSIIGYKFDFTPTSATAGTVTISAAGMMVTSEGGGSYTIEGADTDTPRIAVSATAVGHSPVGSRTGSGMLYIDLLPLESEGCE